MKRYEALNIDLESKEGVRRILSDFACDCPDECQRKKSPETCQASDCAECVADYLFEDMPTRRVTRFEAFKENLDGLDHNAYELIIRFEASATVKCRACKNEAACERLGKSLDCFMKWADAYIEVPR